MVSTKQSIRCGKTELLEISSPKGKYIYFIRHDISDQKEPAVVNETREKQDIVKASEST